MFHSCSLILFLLHICYGPFVFSAVWTAEWKKAILLAWKGEPQSKVKGGIYLFLFRCTFCQSSKVLVFCLNVLHYANLPSVSYVCFKIHSPYFFQFANLLLISLFVFSFVIKNKTCSRVFYLTLMWSAARWAQVVVASSNPLSAVLDTSHSAVLLLTRSVHLSKIN